MAHVDIRGFVYELRLLQFFILWSMAVLIFTPFAFFLMWRKLQVASKRASVAAYCLEALILNDIVTWDLVLGLRKRLGVEELTTDAELQAAMARIVAIAHDIAAWKSETTETLNSLASSQQTANISIADLQTKEAELLARIVSLEAERLTRQALKGVLSHAENRAAIAKHQSGGLNLPNVTGPRLRKAKAKA